jgi:hypothetical protein
LETVISALAPQVDRLNLCLNEYRQVPDFLARYPNLHLHLPTEDLKDEGKFIFEVAADDDVLLVDDDILYPPDYVERMLSFHKVLNFPCAIGVHGIIYSDFFDGRPLARLVAVFHEPLVKYMVVNQLGTGTVLTKGRFLPLRSFMQGSAQFVDVRFARHCLAHGVSLICVPRAKGWLRIVNSGGTSIFDSFTRQPSPTALLEIAEIQGFARLAPAVVQRIRTLNAQLQAAG